MYSQGCTTPTMSSYKAFSSPQKETMHLSRRDFSFLYFIPWKPLNLHSAFKILLILHITCTWIYTIIAFCFCLLVCSNMFSSFSHFITSDIASCCIAKWSSFALICPIFPQYVFSQNLESRWLLRNEIVKAYLSVVHIINLRTHSGQLVLFGEREIA